MNEFEYTVDELLMELQLEYEQLIKMKLDGVLIVEDTEEGYVPVQNDNVIPFPLTRTIQ
jgi:hypothetical protein